MPYYQKYRKYQEQVSYDQGVTWEYVYPAHYAPSGDPIGTYDTLEECMAQYRTIQSGYTCVGYDKHNQDVYEVSYDNGVTWEVVSTSAGTLIEADSPDCGYVPPKFLLTLNDSRTVSADCDSTSAITESEVASLYKSRLVSAEIGDCVNTISSRAFYSCSGLTSIDIPNSVTSIGDSAFDKCSSLASCTIGSGVTTIGSDAFYKCSGLTSIDIPNSVTSIGSWAFADCSSLTSVTIPDSVTSIGGSAFYKCYNLTSIDIPNNVTSIGGGAFYDCSGLTSVTVNATTPPTLGDNVFDGSTCPIYVPASSVNTYKSASGWRTYASRIQAIP